jgi:hypothetical protein
MTINFICPCSSRLQTNVWIALALVQREAGPREWNRILDVNRTFINSSSSCRPWTNTSPSSLYPSWQLYYHGLFLRSSNPLSLANNAVSQMNLKLTTTVPYSTTWIWTCQRENYLPGYEFQICEVVQRIDPVHDSSWPWSSSTCPSSVAAHIDRRIVRLTQNTWSPSI